MNIRIKWKKHKNELTAGPRIVIEHWWRLQLFSRCFGSNGTVYRRWNILAWFPAGKPYWLWALSWEPTWKNLGFSLIRVPGYKTLKLGGTA